MSQDRLPPTSTPVKASAKLAARRHQEQAQQQQQQQQAILHPTKQQPAMDPFLTAASSRERNILYSKLPWGVWAAEKLGLCCIRPKTSYKFLILLLTFCAYTSYHLSRKPTSVVKVALCPHCGGCNVSNTSNSTGWEPFNDESNGNTYLGVLDYSWLFAYAIAMYFSGFLSDRLNLRFFLTIGMIGSGICTCLLGVAYYAQIHKLYYFIIVQFFGGLMQSTGWPGVVAVMSHWFGKHNRGLIMGIWNSHTSVGNILGTIIPSFWADCDTEEGKPWAWSFFVPGFIIIFFGLMLYFFLVTDPTHVGCSPPVHALAEDVEQPASSFSAKDNSVDKLATEDSSLNNGRVIHSGSNDKQNLINSVRPNKDTKAINFFRALTIPGVLEYSLALFFNKLVSYTFLFWLPLYVKNTHPDLTGPQSDWYSTTFDVGGIFGGIVAGVVSDILNARAITCVVMLLVSVPMLYVLLSTAATLSLGGFIALLVINGFLINGPYGMITTAVSSDLGTHPSLKTNTNAKATVTAIIDGTGSLGAAMGPLLFGLISHKKSWDVPFYVLMASSGVSALLLSRLVIYDTLRIYKRISKKFRNNSYSAM